jgi:hypothetical protein
LPHRSYSQIYFATSADLTFEVAITIVSSSLLSFAVVCLDTFFFVDDVDDLDPEPLPSDPDTL